MENTTMTPATTISGTEAKKSRVAVTAANFDAIAAKVTDNTSEWANGLTEGDHKLSLLAVEASETKAGDGKMYFVAKIATSKIAHTIVFIPLAVAKGLLDFVGKPVSFSKRATGKTYTGKDGQEYPSYAYNFDANFAIKA